MWGGGAVHSEQPGWNWGPSRAGQHVWGRGSQTACEVCLQTQAWRGRRNQEGPGHGPDCLCSPVVPGAGCGPVRLPEACMLALPGSSVATQPRTSPFISVPQFSCQWQRTVMLKETIKTQRV